MAKGEKDNGIPYEFWGLITTYPVFGSLLDQFGGRVSDVGDEASYETIDNEEVEEDVYRETTLGSVDFHKDEEGLGVFAGDLGIGVTYDKNGHLNEIDVDLLTYTDFLRDEETKNTDGEVLDQMMATTLENDEQLEISFLLKEKMAAIALMNSKQELKILQEVRNLNFEKLVPMRLFYGDYVMDVAFEVIEDVFYFGILVSKVDEPEDPEAEVLMKTKILTDCNYETFWKSKAGDRYERLAERIFFSSGDSGG